MIINHDSVLVGYPGILLPNSCAQASISKPWKRNPESPQGCRGWYNKLNTFFRINTLMLDRKLSFLWSHVGGSFHHQNNSEQHLTLHLPVPFIRRMERQKNHHKLAANFSAILGGFHIKQTARIYPKSNQRLLKKLRIQPWSISTLTLLDSPSPGQETWHVITLHKICIHQNDFEINFFSPAKSKLSRVCSKDVFLEISNFKCEYSFIYQIQGVQPSYILQRLSMLVACLSRKSTCSAMVISLVSVISRPSSFISTRLKTDIA